MTILFICGSLEDGKDGVGDYTRRLAGEATRLGNSCAILALNDQHASVVRDDFQFDEGTKIKVLRIPTATSWKRMPKHIQDWVNDLDPDLFSLQYVPYSFHAKGLPLGFARNLRLLFGDRNWHIMFHELWVGTESLKLKMLALFQRSIIKSMLYTLNPQLVHTHLPDYHHKLKALDARVSALPLFSNFSADQNDDPEDNLMHSKHNQAPFQANIFRIGFFNQVSDDPQLLDFLEKLANALTATQRPFEIFLIGGAQKRLEAFGATLEQLPVFKGKIKYSGFVDQQQVPALLNACTIGITPMPWSAVGKSGTCAAFLSQGIPVAVPLLDTQIMPFFDQKMIGALIREPDLKAVAKAIKIATQIKGLISLNTITRKFLKDTRIPVIEPGIIITT